MTYKKILKEIYTAKTLNKINRLRTEVVKLQGTKEFHQILKEWQLKYWKIKKEVDNA